MELFKPMRFLCVCFVFAMAVTLTVTNAGDAMAQENLRKMAVPMPEFEPMADALFDAATVLHSEAPVNDKTLSYSVRLPKGFKKPQGASTGSFSLSNKVLGEVARYYGPSNFGVRDYFSLQAVGIDYQVTAEQWLMMHMIENGFAVQGFAVHSDSRAEAVYVIVDRDVSYIVRAVAEVNGGRVIFARYVIAADDWNEKKPIQAKAIESFELTAKSTEYAEEMKTYQFLDIAELQYPVSWELRAKSLRSIDRMDVELLNIRESKGEYKTIKVLDGKIEMHLVSTYIVDDLEAEIEDFKASMKKNNLIVSDLIEDNVNFTYDDGMEFGATSVYEAVDANNSGVEYEFWMSVMRAGEYYYFVSLLTPARKKDYYLWARNTQAFQLVNSYIKPQEDTTLLIEN